MKKLSIFTIIAIFLLTSFSSFSINKNNDQSKAQKNVKLYEIKKYKPVEITIKYKLKDTSTVRLVLFSEDGEEMIILEDSFKEAKKYCYKINTKDLTKNTYFYILETDYGIYSKSFTL
ncbi:MAG: hypothetical protein U9R42_11755 [Bacteroidota bacterium]|nr:hypothetical protein [Bacteroidota bacterium]